MRQVSIAFQTDKRAAEYIALAKLVNQYAFDAVTVYCDAPFHPSFGPLMLMAPHLERARVGVAALSPARIPPIDMAANMALLADVAAGGVYLGLARGAWLAEHGLTEPTRPILSIRECIAIVKRLWAGEAGYAGQVYQLAPHVQAPYPLPQQPIPILIGAWGKQLCAMAGELADEVKVGGSANPDLVPIIKSYIARGETLAGRATGSVGVVMGAVTVVDEDRERARQAARESVALYLPVVATLDPTVQIDPDLLKRVEILVNQGDSQEAGRQISDELLDRFAFAGNAEDLIAHAERLFAAGAHRVEFGTPHGINPQQGIQILGDQVLPALGKHL